MDLQSKIEKEFGENPLLRNLGITIYGSVYESKQKVQQPAAMGAAITSHHATHAHHKNLVCQFSILSQVACTVEPVQVAGPSLMQPIILVPKVVALDRFHCSKDYR